MTSERKWGRLPEIDTDELREKARKATPGPWHHCQPFQVVPKQRTVHGSVPEQRVDYVSTWPGPGTPKGQRVVVPMPREDGPGVRSDDMAFIAAANPATVLSLLDQLQAAERERDEARGKLASVAWIYNPLARARFCRFCQYREDRGHAPSCLLHPDVGPGELVTAGMIDRFLRAWYPGEWPDDPVFDRNRDEAGRTWRERLVEETRAALTAALADPQAERVAELEKALDLILPLAKGYKPDEQTESAKRTCAEWIAVAEAALAAYRSTSRPAGPEDAGEFAAVGDYYIHQNGLWFASLDNPEDRDHVLTLLRSEQRSAELAVEVERWEAFDETRSDSGLPSYWIITGPQDDPTDVAGFFNRLDRDRFLAEHRALAGAVEKARGRLWVISEHEGYTKLHPDENAPGCCQRAYSEGVSAGYAEVAGVAREALAALGKGE